MFHRYLEISVLAGDRLLLLLKVSENLRQSTLRRKGAGVRRTRRSNRKLALEQDHTVVDVLCLCDRKKLRMHLLAVEGKERIEVANSTSERTPDPTTPKVLGGTHTAGYCHSSLRPGRGPKGALRAEEPNMEGGSASQLPPGVRGRLLSRFVSSGGSVRHSQRALPSLY